MAKTTHVRPAAKTWLLSRDDRQGHDVRKVLQHVLPACSDSAWIPTCRGEAQYDRPAWLDAMHQLILHPEQTSSSILRADIIQSDEAKGSLAGYSCRSLIRRRLLPRRPNLDKSIDQECSTYVSMESADAFVVMTPIVEGDGAENIPFYHPKVRSIAFFYRCKHDGTAAHVEIYILPLTGEASFDAAVHPQHRLSRTSLALIDVQSRIAWGKENGYRKRVVHDVIVPRDDYQQLYMRLRQQYAAPLIASWAESTDPQKHVFEDLGIAAFLMLLWRDTFPPMSGSRWGRPSSFVDIGCGNGLLVYLLMAEGYKGYGVDVQERKSWANYRSVNSETDLRAQPIDAPAICLGTCPAFQSGSFLIGNHADELTSWLPLLAQATPDCTGLLNIPCCRFDLNGTVLGMSKYRIEAEDIEALVGTTQLAETMDQISRGPFAETDTRSRNIAYLRYISHLHLQAGWQLEKEALRIPSTKNWAFVGRRRTWQKVGAQRETTDARPAVDVEAHIRHLATNAGANWQARISPSDHTRSGH